MMVSTMIMKTMMINDDEYHGNKCDDDEYDDNENDDDKYDYNK